MKYAKKHSSGRHPNAPKEKTETAVQTVRQIHGVDGANKGCTGNHQGQEKVSAGAYVADGFLKSTFLPKMEAVETIPPPAEVNRIQADFYRSLSELAKHYNGLVPTDTKRFDYPYNMALSVGEVRSYLRGHLRNWNSLELVQDEKGKTFFVSREQYNTGTTLYYIPVIPLYKMLKTNQTKEVATLLLSVFSYLYRVVRIPYYTREDAYIYWEYEMILEWIVWEDESELADRKPEVEEALLWGRKMGRKIGKLGNLNVFEKRVRAFKPKNAFEQDCMTVAKGFFSLYKDFPATSVFMHARYASGDIDGQADVIVMEKYISFVATCKGWLFETLAECVNNEFNECGEIEEPTIIKTFNGSARNKPNLDFENRLFPLIGELCALLDNY